MQVIMLQSAYFPGEQEGGEGQQLIASSAAGGCMSMQKETQCHLRFFVMHARSYTTVTMH